jgi:hypothetical protein
LNFISSFWGYFLGLSLQPDIHTKKVIQKYKCNKDIAYARQWSGRLKTALKTAINQGRIKSRNASKRREARNSRLPTNNNNGRQQDQGRSQQPERQQCLQQQGRQQHSSNIRNASNSRYVNN